MEEHLASLAACLCASHGTSLAKLAEALHITIPAAREGVLRIADRLAAVGMRAVDDGVEVRLVPLPLSVPAVAAVTEIEALGELSDEQVASSASSPTTVPPPAGRSRTSAARIPRAC